MALLGAELEKLKLKSEWISKKIKALKMNSKDNKKTDISR